MADNLKGLEKLTSSSWRKHVPTTAADGELDALELPRLSRKQAAVEYTQTQSSSSVSSTVVNRVRDAFDRLSCGSTTYKGESVIDRSLYMETVAGNSATPMQSARNKQPEAYASSDRVSNVVFADLREVQNDRKFQRVLSGKCPGKTIANGGSPPAVRLPANADVQIERADVTIPQDASGVEDDEGMEEYTEIWEESRTVGGLRDEFEAEVEIPDDIPIIEDVFPTAADSGIVVDDFSEADSSCAEFVDPGLAQDISTLYSVDVLAQDNEEARAPIAPGTSNDSGVHQKTGQGSPKHARVLLGLLRPHVKDFSRVKSNAVELPNVCRGSGTSSSPRIHPDPSPPSVNMKIGYTRSSYYRRSLPDLLKMKSTWYKLQRMEDEAGMVNPPSHRSAGRDEQQQFPSPRSYLSPTKSASLRKLMAEATRSALEEETRRRMPITPKPRTPQPLGAAFPDYLSSSPQSSPKETSRGTESTVDTGAKLQSRSSKSPAVSGGSPVKGKKQKKSARSRPKKSPSKSTECESPGSPYAASLPQLHRKSLRKHRRASWSMDANARGRSPSALDNWSRVTPDAASFAEFIEDVKQPAAAVEPQEAEDEPLDFVFGMYPFRTGERHSQSKSLQKHISLTRQRLQNLVTSSKMSLPSTTASDAPPRPASATEPAATVDAPAAEAQMNADVVLVDSRTPDIEPGEQYDDDFEDFEEEENDDDDDEADDDGGDSSSAPHDDVADGFQIPVQDVADNASPSRGGEATMTRHSSDPCIAGKTVEAPLGTACSGNSGDEESASVAYDGSNTLSGPFAKASWMTSAVGGSPKSVRFS